MYNSLYYLFFELIENFAENNQYNYYLTKFELLLSILDETLFNNKKNPFKLISIIVEKFNYSYIEQKAHKKYKINRRYDELLRFLKKKPKFSYDLIQFYYMNVRLILGVKNNYYYIFKKHTSKQSKKNILKVINKIKCKLQKTPSAFFSRVEQIEKNKKKKQTFPDIEINPLSNKKEFGKNWLRNLKKTNHFIDYL